MVGLASKYFLFCFIFCFFLNTIPSFRFVEVNIGDWAKVVIHLFIQQIFSEYLYVPGMVLGARNVKI